MSLFEWVQTGTVEPPALPNPTRTFVRVFLSFLLIVVTDFLNIIPTSHLFWCATDKVLTYLCTHYLQYDYNGTVF